jgi:hypothetical protein
MEPGDLHDNVNSDHSVAMEIAVKLQRLSANEGGAEKTKKCHVESGWH